MKVSHCDRSQPTIRLVSDTRLDAQQCWHRLNLVMPGDEKVAVVDGVDSLGKARVVLAVHGERLTRGCELRNGWFDQNAGWAISFHDEMQAIGEGGCRGHGFCTVSVV